VRSQSQQDDVRFLSSAHVLMLVPQISDRDPLFEDWAVLLSEFRDRQEKGCKLEIDTGKKEHRGSHSKCERSGRTPLRMAGPTVMHSSCHCQYCEKHWLLRRDRNCCVACGGPRRFSSQKPRHNTCVASFQPDQSCELCRHKPSALPKSAR